jgi:ABC-2 type transport system ATP-binding protein
VIETRGLRKSFTSRQGREKKVVQAVRGVDLDVAEGEIFGFLGPNGAGESTAREELVLQARLYGIGKSDAQSRADRVLGAFQLSEYADRKCKTYSGGQRRRVDIALGIIHEPKVVFLDEPTSGLDPQSRAHMWEEIRRLRADGMTVFITTHYLDEADALCDRLSIMDYGEIVASGTPADLKREISGDVVRVGLSADVVAQAAEVLGDATYINKLETHDDSIRLYVEDGATAIPLILRALDAGSVPLGSIELNRPSLDDVFLTKTGRSLREN